MAPEFEKMLKESNSRIDRVIALDVADDVVIKRITGRRTCSKCKTIYNIYYKPSRIDGKCDECGGDLYTRNDDNLDSLKKRLSEYHINAESLDEAINHIAQFGSGHSESIITDDEAAAERFQNEVDAACVYVNAPTSFTDGAQFGLGAEIGISTQKLGPRGPMGLMEMTTYKWLINGNGQTRA